MCVFTGMVRDCNVSYRSTAQVQSKASDRWSQDPELLDPDRTRKRQFQLEDSVHIYCMPLYFAICYHCHQSNSFIHSFDDRFIWSFADDTTEVMLQGWLRNITISPPSLDVYQALTFPETKAVRATNAFDWQQALDSVILTRIHSGYECSTHRAISAIRLCLIISLMTTIGIAITTGSWIRIVD